MSSIVSMMIAAAEYSEKSKPTESPAIEALKQKYISDRIDKFKVLEGKGSLKISEIATIIERDVSDTRINVKKLIESGHMKQVYSSMPALFVWISEEERNKK